MVLTNDIETYNHKSSSDLATAELSSFSQCLGDAVERSRKRVQHYMVTRGITGLSVGVSVNGRTVWLQGYGYANVELGVAVTPETKMRIGSINKPITMAIVGQLVESGKMNLEDDIQSYVTSFPNKTFADKDVVLQIRHLVTNTSGIRHYETKDNVWSSLTKPAAAKQNSSNTKTAKKDKSSEENKPVPSSDSPISKLAAKPDKLLVNSDKTSEKYETGTLCKVKPNEKQETAIDERSAGIQNVRYTSPRRLNFPSALESLSMFADDPLVCQPGSRFHYSTHGWTLLSAAVAAVSKTSMEHCVLRFCCDIGMLETVVDRRTPVLSGRASHYTRDANHVLQNVVVGDAHWPGAVITSTARDLLVFGNYMLKSCFNTGDEFTNANSGNGVLLKSDTVRQIWTPAIDTGGNSLARFYGMGWRMDPTHDQGTQTCNFAYHTGAGAGSSGVLFVRPLGQRETLTDVYSKPKEEQPTGICVAILANVDKCSRMECLAFEIAEIFRHSEV